MIVLTGATDGIGLCLARIYQDRGEPLMLIGRRELADLADDLFSDKNYCRADLSLPGCEDIVEAWLSERGIEQVDLLIHNAGTGYAGAVQEQSVESIREVTELNFLTPVAMTHRLLPRLVRPRSRAKGKVVFISSILSAMPCPDYATYGATKAALDSLARNIRLELAGSVRVQAIRPGAVRTRLHEKIGMNNEAIGWEKFPPPEAIAEKIARAIESDRAAITIGTGNAIVRLAARWMPQVFDRLARGNTS